MTTVVGMLTAILFSPDPTISTLWLWRFSKRDAVLPAQPSPREEVRQALSAYQIKDSNFMQHLLTRRQAGEIRRQSLVDSKWKFFPDRSDSGASWPSVIMDLQIPALAL